MAKRKPKRKGHGEAPFCNCLLLCDDVLVSEGRGKHILHGVIGTIGVIGFPAAIGGHVAYVRMSNVYGAQDIQLQFVEAATDEAVFQIDVRLSAKSDPLGVYNIILPVPPFVVQRPGRYLFTAIHQGTPITYTPVIIQGPGLVEEESREHGS